jgi:hypothetical protein
MPRPPRNKPVASAACQPVCFRAQRSRRARSPRRTVRPRRPTSRAVLSRGGVRLPAESTTKPGETLRSTHRALFRESQIIRRRQTFLSAVLSNRNFLQPLRRIQWFRGRSSDTVPLTRPSVTQPPTSNQPLPHRKAASKYVRVVQRFPVRSRFNKDQAQSGWCVPACRSMNGDR